MAPATAASLSVQQAGKEYSGTWEELVGVSYQETLVRINGIPLPNQFFLALTLPGGDRMRLSTRNKEMGAAFQEVLRLSAPAQIARAVDAFRAGKDVDFGAIRLSPQRLAIKKRSRWTEVPLSEVSGWIVREGYFMADRGHERPGLCAELQVAQVMNLAALQAVLRQALPDAELARPEVAQRSVARSSKMPWGPSIAATRMPGYPTRRTRFLVAMALPALAVLYTLVALPWAFQKLSFDSRLYARFNEVS